MSDASDSFAVGGAETRRLQERHNWHTQLFRSGAPSSGNPAERIDEVEHVGEDAAPRARRSLLSSSGGQPDDSSIVFEVERSMSAASGVHVSGNAPDGAHRHQFPTSRVSNAALRQTGADSSIQFDVVASPQPDPCSRRRSSGAVVVGSYRDPLARLYHVGLDRKLAKQQWACLERAKRSQLEEMSNGCTFQPEVSPLARSISRPKELSPEFRATSEVHRKAEWRAARRTESLEAELAECTFKPLTLSAAKLHASALIRRVDLHDQLYADHKKRGKFREAVQAKVVQELEKRMIHKPFRSRASSPDGVTSDVMSVEEVNAIVHRLLHTCIGFTEDDPAERGETFRPKLNPKSVELATQRRKASPQGTTPAAAASDLECHGPPVDAALAHDAVAQTRSALGSQRRKHHAELLFGIIAEHAIAKQRAKSQEKDPGPPLTEELLKMLELPIAAVNDVARQLLADGAAKEVQRALQVCERHGLRTITRSNFVNSLLGFTSFTSFDVTHPRRDKDTRHSASPLPDGATEGIAAETGASSRGAVVDHAEVVQRLMRQQQRVLNAVEAERRQAAADAAAREMKECTFQPAINRRHESDVNRGVRHLGTKDPSSSNRTRNNSASKKETLKYSSSLTEVAQQLSELVGKKRRSQSESGAVELEHHTLRREEPGILDPYPNAVAGGRAAGASGTQQGPPGQTIGSSSHRSAVGGKGLYRDAISEHAAFGSAKALHQLGTELMKRQLEGR